jgi:hypothetical protein
VVVGRGQWAWHGMGMAWEKRVELSFFPPLSQLFFFLVFSGCVEMGGRWKSLGGPGERVGRSVHKTGTDVGGVRGDTGVTEWWLFIWLQEGSFGAVVAYLRWLAWGE